MKAHSTHRGLLQAALLLLTLLVLTAGGAFAQIRIDLHDFNPTRNGAYPNALVQGTDGNFYGTTAVGGASVWGTIFKITPAGRLTTLHSFSGPDGANPIALVQGTDGNFYGTTYNGGVSGDGTIFKVTPSGSLTTLYSFSGSDGASPLAGLVQGADGNFYGTTELGGGTENEGTIFKITPSGSLTTLHSFSSSDGGYPEAALVQGTDGNFYGTTDGDQSDLGTIFKITPSGSFTDLYTFSGPDGARPDAALVQGKDGNFYGITTYGVLYSDGSDGCGTIFKITPTGSLTTLYSFSGLDGAYPSAPLVQGTDGNFYGTTDGGTIFKITPSGDLTTLYSSSGPAEADPYALAQGTDGNFYGTTGGDGGTNLGTIFKITPSGNLTTLYTFYGPDGANSESALVQGTDGNFYGTTGRGGGPSDDGAIFRITPSGSLTTLYSFSGQEDGAYPAGALVQATDGNFYGTTANWGGTFNGGTIFKITPSGSFTTMYSFSGPDGSNPVAALVQGSDGNFYGTTSRGGATGLGTVFKITPSGSLTTLYSFSGLDGNSPDAALVEGTDGSFYGTTSYGGVIQVGTIFKITPTGSLTTLYSFSDYGTSGNNPISALIEGTDGSFYGTTEFGGASGGGTIFKITPSGSMTQLYSFSGPDGGYPDSGLVQGTDGNFYGTTAYWGGTNNDGTIFRITPSGNLTKLYSFSGPDGANPGATLVQGTDGNYYGTTQNGGAKNDGTVFELVLSLTAPTGLTAVAGNQQISLSWATSPLSTSYNVYRGTTSGGEGTTPIATGIITASYTNSGLIAGTAYYYRVAAVDAAGTSGQSSEAHAITIPAVPVGVTAAAGNARVQINFTSSTGASHYDIYRSTTSSGEGATPYVTGVGAAGYTDTGVTNGVTYYYTVAAIDVSGTSVQSTQVSAAPIGAPTKPTGLTAVGSSGQVSLRWNPTTGATSYNLCRSTVHAGETLYKSGIAGTSFVDNGVSNGVTYYYRLVAVNAGGETYSSEVKATP